MACNNQPNEEEHLTETNNGHISMREFFNDDEVIKTVNIKLNNIIEHGYNNMYNKDDKILDFIDSYYIQNLEYENLEDKIYYTIKSVLNVEVEYTFENILSNLFYYALSDQNKLFTYNFKLVFKIISSELKRLIMLDMTIHFVSFIRRNQEEELENLEDIKLIVSEDEINKITLMEYNKVNNKKELGCVICQENFENDDKVRVLQCEHIYHKECIDNWLGNHSYKCPTCRSCSTPYIQTT